ncbi:MAG: cell wall hydrolase [Sphingomonadaceae bacterium]|nr:cell wall hydrolase [Sphingomonadaceae bacterium]
MSKRSIFSAVLLASAISCSPQHPTDRAVSAASGEARIALARAPTPVEPAAPPSTLLKPLVLGPGDQSADFAEAPPFATPTDSDNAGRALECLTAAIYYEARSEPIDGQRAVAQVVLNRVRNAAFPSSVCGVVYQGSNRTTGCQFTFTCDGSLLRPREAEAWERARLIAQAALEGDVYAPVGAATYYHTTAVSPWWAPSLNRVAQIGAHIFYSLSNGWDRALDFRQQYSGLEPRDVPGAVAATVDVGDAAVDFVRAAGATIAVHRGASDSSDGVMIHRGSAQQVSAATTNTTAPQPNAIADAAPLAKAADASDGRYAAGVHIHLGGVGTAGAASGSL